MTTDQNPPTARRRRKWPWIVGGLVVALVLYIGISAATGFQTRGDPEPASAATSTTRDLYDQRTELDQVIAVAASKCTDQVRLRYADPDAKIGGWEITADNPAGRTPPAWRVQGQTMSRTSMRTPLQILCDVEYLPYDDQYRITLVS